ncbi:MAG: TonB-dependent receptor [Arcicella sp.]|nr:TonB-dependent receptor [Arcicella sp.]
MKKNLLSLLLVLFSISSFAQVVVSGKIVDADVQQPLPGANVVIKGKVDKGTITDANGKFSVRMDANADAIEVSFIGYETIKVKLGSVTQNLTISLVPSTEDLNEVQVIGFATERSLQETSASISLLTTKDLSKTNATSLTQSLNNLPGIRIDQSGLDNQRVTIRGIGANSNLGVRGIKVYFNDIPLTEPDGYTRMEALDFTTIGRVEIIRGPASSLYGTANGGVMNFSSEKAPYGGTSIQYGGLFGSYGLGRSGLIFKHGSEKANIYASVTSQGSDGFRLNNRSDRDNVNFAGQFFLTSKFSINTVFARLHDNVRYPLALTYDQAKADPSQDALVSPVSATLPNGRRASFYSAGRDQTWTRWGLNAKYEISDALKLSASYFGGKNDQISNSLTGPATTFTSLGTSEGVRAILTFKPKMEKLKTSFNAGVEYQTFTQDGQNYSVSTTDNSRAATPAASVLNGGSNTLYFIQADVELTPKTILTLGSGFISYNYFRTDKLRGNTTDNKDFNNQVAPRIALNHNFGDFLALRASLSKGFTPPILNEAVFSATSGNFIPTLDASTSQQVEFGARGSILKKRLTYDIAYYNMKIDNELVTETRDFVPIARNAAKTNRNGFEISLAYDAIKAEDKEAISLLRYRASFTSQDFKYESYQKETRYNVTAFPPALYARYGQAGEPTLEVTENEPVLQPNGQYLPSRVVRGILKEGFSGNTIPGYAPIMFNLGVDIESTMGLYATVNYNFVDKTELYDGNSALTLRSAATGQRTLVAGTGTATVPAVAQQVTRTVRDAYSIINVAFGYQKTFGMFGLRLYANIDNLSDTQYSGFVRVNDDQGRYFNPSLPRNFSLGTNLTFNF